jgi:hypothetical protein
MVDDEEDNQERTPVVKAGLTAEVMVDDEEANQKRANDCRQVETDCRNQDRRGRFEAG